MRYELKLPAILPRRPSVESITMWLLLSFMMLFALWTLAYHMATFAHVPWYWLTRSASLLAIPAWILSLVASRPLADTFACENTNATIWRGLPDRRALAVVVAAAILIAVLPSFTTRFLVCAIAIGVLWRLPESTAKPDVTTSKLTELPPAVAALILLALIALGVAVTLLNHRSDFDDAEYIQMALQTLQHPLRPPLTFDTSLGDFFNVFRFAPYRLDSYEMLVALVSWWTSTSVLTAYYVIVPGVTAALSIATAYLFSRWFLPSRATLLCTAIFLALMFAWGETHIAYGNRVFVRLYQGKGLLISLTTPLTLLAGLIFLRRPRFLAWLALFAAQIAAIGVSSSGLVVTLVVTAILVVLCLEADYKAMIFKMSAIAASAIYPLICGLWLKYSHSGVPAGLAEVGSNLPINASLGNGLREGISLVIMIAGVATVRRLRSGRELFLLIVAVFLLGLNPWLSSLAAAVTARNMHWRIAWAAPVPLIIAIALSGNILLICEAAGRQSRLKIASASLAILALCSFLFSARPALSRSNNVSWGPPGPTVPAEYQQADAITVTIKDWNITGRVLAAPPIGTWLTVTMPGLRLVMPGHGYPICWQTVLPRAEFSERMTLLSAVQGNPVDLSGIPRLVQQYDVEVIIAPENTAADRLADYLNQHTNFNYVDTAHIQGYVIYRRVHS